MMQHDRHMTFYDAFNLLCGRKIGNGIHRDVFECKLRPELVVKVESTLDDEMRNFANVREDLLWSYHSEYQPVAKWLAPVEYLSPDGRILLQRKCQPVRESELPEKLPAFLTDVKPENFGMLDGRVVCFDYALHIPNPSIQMRKADWRT